MRALATSTVIDSYEKRGWPTTGDVVGLETTDGRIIVG